MLVGIHFGSMSSCHVPVLIFEVILNVTFLLFVLYIPTHKQGLSGALFFDYIKGVKINRSFNCFSSWLSGGFLVFRTHLPAPVLLSPGGDASLFFLRTWG